MSATLHHPLSQALRTPPRPRVVVRRTPARACRECVSKTAAAALAKNPPRPASPRLAALGSNNDGDSGDRSTDPMKAKAGDSAPLSAALAALRFYKAAISPLLPPSCRFLPTCSEYAARAYREFGIGKGTVLTAWRLVRCNPWGGRGWDPPVWPPVGIRGGE